MNARERNAPTGEGAAVAGAYAGGGAAAGGGGVVGGGGGGGVSGPR
ncbi:hypothetical protein [Streptomyces sp. NPDC048172]